MSQPSLVFIGAGNMANSIIGGLVAQGYAPERITACDPSADNLTQLQSRYGIATSDNNASAAAAADVVVLAVKPQVMKIVCQQLAPQLAHRPLIISIAAGIPLSSFDLWLDAELPLVRCMPNTPALVQAGASGLYANQQTTDQQRQVAEQILSAVGSVQWLNSEADIDAVTAVSGSGPAYFFLMMEAMIEAGVKQGLERDVATELTLQTALGAAKLAQSSDVDVAELRRRVTSPAGTTEQALLSFEASGLRDTVERAMRACADRSIEMASELGQ